MQNKLRNPNFLPTHEDVLSAFSNSKQWHNFCISKHSPVYEFLNKEYIQALANYLGKRGKLLGANKKNHS